MTRQFSSRNLRSNKRQLFKEQDNLRTLKSMKKKIIENMCEKKSSSVDVEVKSVVKKKGIPVSGDILKKKSSEGKRRKRSLLKVVVIKRRQKRGL